MPISYICYARGRVTAVTSGAGRGRAAWRRWSTLPTRRRRRPCSRWSSPSAWGGEGGGAVARSSCDLVSSLRPRRNHYRRESSQPAPRAISESFFFFQLLVNLLKTVRSADKVPSPSLVLLPISIPGQLQPFEWQRLQSRPLATPNIKPIQ